MSKITKSDIQEEALKKIIKRDRSGCAISMGVGKTYLGLQYLEHLKYFNKSLKVLIVAPKIPIIQSWKDEAIKHDMEHVLINATFSTYLSLHKQDTDYDVIILDECHSLLFSHDEYLSKVNSKILGLTGTPPVNQYSEKYTMVNKYCPIVYKYITKTAVEDKILNDYEIIVHYLYLNNAKNIEVKLKSGSFYTSELSSYMFWTTRVETSSGKSKQIASVMRMKAMMEYKSKEVYAKKLFDAQKDKTILFCNTQKQADSLCKHSYHSKNPDSEVNLDLFKNNNITKLSTVLQLNEGINIPNLKSAIIMHSYGNERKTNQRLGRTLRLNPKDKATIHILCYKGTVDEKWVQTALAEYDQSKIKYVNESN